MTQRTWISKSGIEFKVYPTANGDLIISRSDPRRPLENRGFELPPELFDLIEWAMKECKSIQDGEVVK